VARAPAGFSDDDCAPCRDLPSAATERFEQEKRRGIERLVRPETIIDPAREAARQPQRAPS
jgi:hypothetical protein